MRGRRSKQCPPARRIQIGAVCAVPRRRARGAGPVVRAGDDGGSGGSRCAASRPCRGRALPWNASFMTIPFSKGGSARKHTGSSGNSNSTTLGPPGRGFRRSVLREMVFSCAVRNYGARWPGGCLLSSRSRPGQARVPAPVKIGGNYHGRTKGAGTRAGSEHAAQIGAAVMTRRTIFHSSHIALGDESGRARARHAVLSEEVLA